MLGGALTARASAAVPLVDAPVGCWLCGGVDRAASHRLGDASQGLVKVGAGGAEHGHGRGPGRGVWDAGAGACAPVRLAGVPEVIMGRWFVDTGVWESGWLQEARFEGGCCWGGATCEPETCSVEAVGTAAAIWGT